VFCRHLLDADDIREPPWHKNGLLQPSQHPERSARIQCRYIQLAAAANFIVSFVLLLHFLYLARAATTWFLFWQDNHILTH